MPQCLWCLILKDKKHAGISSTAPRAALAEDMAEAMPIREMARFYRQPLPERRMIVKKLLNAADYDWYAQDIVDYYKDTEPGTPQANLVVALKTYLDNL